jgi:transcriptional regulator with XRE-family HTH domain
MTPTEFREARHKLGLTQAQMAEALGYKRLHISQMETGKSPIQRTTELAMMALAAGLAPVSNQHA